jgi:hypothetical protein
MSNINIFITHQGVHKTIDKVLNSNNVAIPKSTLYQNISVPRWNNIIGVEIKDILSNLFYNDYSENFIYNIGFFKDNAKTGNFAGLFEKLPAGTKIWFVKTTVEDYREIFQDWIKILRSRNQEKSLRRKFREDSTFSDIDIDVEYEERTVELDDFADLFSASDWQSFDSNVYLNTGSAESSLLQARLFVKAEDSVIPFKKKKKKKNKKTNEQIIENIDEDDDYIDEDDL